MEYWFPSSVPNERLSSCKIVPRVLTNLVAENADIIAIQETKLSLERGLQKHWEILEELFPGYENTWRSSQEPAQRLRWNHVPL